MGAEPKKLVRARAPMLQAEFAEAVRRHDRYLTGRLGGQRALLSYRDLSGLDLAGQRLNDSDFTGAFLIGARMAGANLTGANLFGCNMMSADLRGAILVRADLRGAVLRGANLEGADLFNADLRDGRLGQRVRIGVIEEVAIADTAASDLQGARMV
ncbi:MAG: pentapeptide repeat-containing protein, partial [Alphaproteobacteria bacterium]